MLNSYLGYRVYSLLQQSLKILEFTIRNIKSLCIADAVFENCVLSFLLFLKNFVLSV